MKGNFDEKKYYIDYEKASARDIIRSAKALDPSFGNDGVCFTSEAADILRQNGYWVSDQSCKSSGKLGA